MVEFVTVNKPFITCNCKLAEGPTYDYRTDRLYWIDIEQKRVYWSDIFHSSSAADTTDTEAGHTDFSYVALNDSVGVLGLTAVPGVLVAGAKKGYAKLDLRSAKHGDKLTLDYIKLVFDHDKDPQSQQMRLNDGAVDTHGRFFVGSMVDAGYQLKPIGNLHVLTAEDHDRALISSESQQFKLDVAIPNVTIPNGLGWTADNKTMYFTDSPTSTIWKLDYDQDTGAVKNKVPYIKVQVDGMDHPEPDGFTLSEDGSIWTAIWGSHLLRRYGPGAELLQEFRFPNAQRITCATFAGPKLDKLIVSTASQRLGQDGKDAANKPLDLGGNLFLIDVKDTVGIKKNIFKGI